MAINQYETQLSGGHPNSLGNTVSVVEDVLKNRTKLQELYDCYQSSDEVVRLRVSSAIKRVCKAKPEWVADYLDGFINEISQIDQASTKWTLARLFMLLDSFMTASQRKASIGVMRQNLQTNDDWIVLNTTSESLAYFAKQDDALREWLQPQLKNLTHNKRKSVARRAEKLLNTLSSPKIS